ncbi:MAG: N-6 DNA methylase [Deltaproteobacteria bacterium]|nr:N-6 DNA methylase [Deltaproteobacteria bacterium]
MKMLRELGSIYTPIDYAHFLTEWAIQNSTDLVMDLGVGEGVFVFASYERLLALGANKLEGQNQIYGTEVDEITYKKFLVKAENLDTCFPNLHYENFFNIKFPTVDSIVGNPPYVRRKHIDGVDKIRDRVLEINKKINAKDLNRLTDLYVYFLLHALPMLKPEGRLAIIVADSWLNVGYGKVLKQYLKQEYNINRLISLDRRVFDDAQVKPVLLLATKKSNSNSQWVVSFTRIKNGLPISSLQHFEDWSQLDDVATVNIPAQNLKIEHPWGIHFKASEIYQLLSKHKLTTYVNNLADTRIGIQTLAKDFFVLTPKQAQNHRIELDYLQSLAQSAKHFDAPVIEQHTPETFLVFYCAKSKKKLQGTRALEYIIKGEKTTVKVRGKNETVVGYQNKKRIQQAKRSSWYDLRSDIERRGRAEILIPRLVYRKFMVLWNKANYVPGELFIEFLPKEKSPDIEAYLAVLNSIPTEIMLRMYAQVYGGGTYNIRPGQVKMVSMLDVTQLTNAQKNNLVQAYRQYLADESYDRFPINHAVYDILGFNTEMRQKMDETLKDLISIATSAKESPH